MDDLKAYTEYQNMEARKAADADLMLKLKASVAMESIHDAAQALRKAKDLLDVEVYSWAKAMCGNLANELDFIYGDIGKDEG